MKWKEVEMEHCRVRRRDTSLARKLISSLLRCENRIEGRCQVSGSEIICLKKEEFIARLEHGVGQRRDERPEVLRVWMKTAGEDLTEELRRECRGLLRFQCESGMDFSSPNHEVLSPTEMRMLVG